MQRDVWNNGWTLPELRGQKLLVSVDFGTGAVTMAIAGAVLWSWPIRTYTDGITFDKKYGPVPRNNIGNAEMGGCADGQFTSLN